MALNKGRCTSPDLVDVVNLPRTVVQKGCRGLEDKQIMVIGGASQECTNVSDVVTDLESDMASEEVVGCTEIRGRKDDMPKLSRANSLITQDGWGTRIHSLGCSRTVVTGSLYDRRCQSSRHLKDHSDPRAGLHCRDRRLIRRDVVIGGLERCPDAIEVIGTIDTDDQLDQSPGRRRF
jgi:hypothetical protein